MTFFLHMKKFTRIALIVWLLCASQARADEGMWLLPLIQELNMKEMQEMGLKLTADQIYNINKSSIKDAVGALDYGSCTAELISPDGLLLTNHHCGFDEIQSHSSVTNDYLTDGFWAMNREEELPNPGKTISFVVRMEDVSDRIVPRLADDLSEDERLDKVNEISEFLTKEATEGTHYEARIEPFFGGNTYYLVVMETFEDVRLVGAPPESIGKFGHDSDNWEWPRHTGDFSLFRVYTGPDGKPAKYAEENIPLNPEYFFPISLNGIEEGDFSMVVGFPGTTNRYLTSYEINEIQDIDNPNQIKIRGKKLELMMEDMQSDDAIRIKYASKYSSSSNYWKYSIGQNQGIHNLDLISRTEALEDDYRDWLKSDTHNNSMYGESINLIQSAINSRKEIHHAQHYLLEALIGGIEFINFAGSFFQVFFVLLESPDDPEAVGEVVKTMREEMATYYKDYNPETDKKITKAMFRLVGEDIPARYHPEFYATINNKFKGDYEKYVDYVFKKSIFVDPVKVNEFLDTPDLKTLQKDLAFAMARDIYRKYFEIDDQYMEYRDNLDKGRRMYIAGLMEMQKSKTFYPDANSTLRLTYGQVGDYEAKDAVFYNYYTTLTGVMEKEDPDNFEYAVPEKLKTLYRDKDFGIYGTDDYMPVCFTTNNDITGGNSGSPVLNANGELIGVAFDGNWEAMSGDIVFENDIQKCINVDIRYVLFIIDKYAGATHLIDEMKIVE